MEETLQKTELNEDQSAIQRALILRDERKQILNLPPEKALDLILDSPHSTALVHSFPEEDFYFLIHDIGVHDSLELLSMASDKQWEYLLDVEVWQKDRISISSVTKWFYLLQKADPYRLIRWVLNEEKTEFIQFYLLNNIEVIVREHDQDPSDFEDDFFTIDDVFYVRLKENPDDNENKEERDEFLMDFLQRLADQDHVQYQNILFEFQSIISAETEERIYHWRNIRLAEKGFMPFDEAVSIYQPLKPEHFKKAASLKKTAISYEKRYEPLPPVPFYPTKMLNQEDLFTNSLKVIETDEVLQQIQSEFAGLCNQIISADQRIIKEKEELKNIVKKACGYLSIGIERLSKKPLDTNRIAALIQRFPLIQIFRVGYGLALELKWKAEKWRKKSWAAERKLPLTFWGEEWLGFLGGLLLKKPLFYDNYKTGVLYREFASLEDIRITEKMLNEIIDFDNLLSLIPILIQPVPEGFLTYKNALLTLWARDYLGLPEEFSAITIDDFKRFFNSIWIENEKPRKIRLSVKESFLHWLSDKTGMDSYDITQRLGQTLENLFQEIEDEYSGISLKNLDPKHIYLFLVSE